MLTHRNLVANSFHKTIACGLRSSDVFLASGPFFHVAGTAPALSLVWLGGSLVVLPGFDAGACLDVIERHGVTVYMPVPTMLAALAAEQKARPRDVSSLRLIGHAGSPITTAVIRDAHETFPARPARSVLRRHRDGVDRDVPAHEEQLLDGGPLGSVGQPVVGVAVDVLDADGTPCAPGEVGEVVARGPNVTSGYWEDDEATRAAFVDGWYRMGDVGYFDEERNLWLLDRAKDMIVTGGENVYSIEVEEVLARHPAVVESAVFGVPDERWVEAVHAVVVVALPDADAATRLPRSSAPTAGRRSPASRCPNGSSCAPSRYPSPGRARSRSASSAPRTGTPPALTLGVGLRRLSGPRQKFSRELGWLSGCASVHAVMSLR